MKTTAITLVLSVCIAVPAQTEEPGTIWFCGQEIALDEKEVSCNDKNLADISELAKLTNLRRLSLIHTQVSDISPLKGAENLIELSLALTQVHDLTPLSGLPNFTWLNLKDTPVSDLTPLKHCPKLTFLYINGTKVSDLTPIQGLPKLGWMHISRTPITDLAPLIPTPEEDIERTERAGEPVRRVRLKALDMYEVRVSESQIEELKKAAPGIKIVR